MAPLALHFRNIFRAFFGKNTFHFAAPRFPLYPLPLWRFHLHFITGCHHNFPAPFRVDFTHAKPFPRSDFFVKTRNPANFAPFLYTFLVSAGQCRHQRGLTQYNPAPFAFFSNPFIIILAGKRNHLTIELPVIKTKLMASR
jgi:hypothetical protein